MSITFREPARRWNPSTFCVSTQTRSNPDSISAITSCPRFGPAPRHACSIWSRYFQVRAGRADMTSFESNVSIGSPSSGSRPS
jgi:hypothetical protein